MLALVLIVFAPACVALCGCALAHERRRIEEPFVRPMDVNGDGYADLAVASFTNVYVYFGGPSGLPPEPSQTITPPGRYGLGIFCPGDVDGDGYSDLVVSFSGDSDSTISTAIVMGRALVMPGSPTGVDSTRARRLDPSSVVTAWGPSASFRVANAVRDLDGDGLDDIFASVEAGGVPGAPRSRIVLFRGARGFFSSPSSPSPSVLAESADLSLSWVQLLGDVDGDDRPDVSIFGTTPTGWETFVLGSRDQSLQSLCRTDRTGGPCSVEPAGDVDGDGRDDLLFSQAGHVFVTPNEALLSGGTRRELPRPADATPMFGPAFGGADLDGDQLLDVVALDRATDGFQRSAVIYWSGDGAPQSIASTLPPTAMADGFDPTDMSGDFDGDGRVELVASNLEHEVVEVLAWPHGRGAPSVAVIRAPAPGAHFGQSIAAGY
jgi:hypothetical protein